MERTHGHRFQVLTKRTARLAEVRAALPWPPNVRIGVRVENELYPDRVDRLREVPGRVRFLSLEPLLGPRPTLERLLGPRPTLDLTGIHWVIVGGESGPGARPVKESWAIEIRDQCRRAGVPFFFKQWGGSRRKARGRRLDGREWNEMPALTRSTAESEHGKARGLRSPVAEPRLPQPRASASVHTKPGRSDAPAGLLEPRPEPGSPVSAVSRYST